MFSLKCFKILLNVLFLKLQHLKGMKNIERSMNSRVILAQGPC